jgi:DNA processing protein
MNSKQLTLIPLQLSRIASPPKQLFCAGEPLNAYEKLPKVAIVGSRNVSPYGKEITRKLAAELAQQGIVIVSGLALGVDGIAHQAALDAQGKTIAVLPSPINQIAPTRHIRLAEAIVGHGGALLSEYAEGEFPLKQNFIARNRLVAGLADAVLITEAAEKSGSLHTARFALEQGKEVLAVPGNITSAGSVGTNNLIKAGATPVTSYLDVLHVLNLTPQQTHVKDTRGRNQHEQRVIDLLLQGIRDGDELLNQSRLSIAEFNQVLTMLEVGGKIRSLGANQWSLY